jgi:hypothetical protein
VVFGDPGARGGAVATLRMTPAMEVAKADHVWNLEEIAALAE